LRIATSSYNFTVESMDDSNRARSATSFPARFRVWAREPLLHFVLLGALLFGLDHVLVSRRDDPRVIVIDGVVDEQARKAFRDARGREPGAEELYALRKVWLDNEVLYREGLAMQLDKGDTAMRERVIFKALSVVNANVKLPPVDDAVLRDFFLERRDKYDEPTRYDFQEAVLFGDTSEAAAREFALALNRGTPGDTKAGLRVFKGRPHENLVQSYGAPFANALKEGPVGEWRVYATADGFRVMRLDAIAPPRPASFEAVRGVVRQDWTDYELARQRSEMVRQMAMKYRIEYAGTGK
jgi:hypothetical protein